MNKDQREKLKTIRLICDHLIEKTMFRIPAKHLDCIPDFLGIPMHMTNAQKRGLVLKGPSQKPCGIIVYYFSTHVDAPLYFEHQFKQKPTKKKKRKGENGK